jgi:hypothetical protein
MKKMRNSFKVQVKLCEPLEPDSDFVVDIPFKNITFPVMLDLITKKAQAVIKLDDYIAVAYFPCRLIQEKSTNDKTATMKFRPNPDNPNEMLWQPKI